MAPRTLSADNIPRPVYGSRCCYCSSVHCCTAHAVWQNTIDRTAEFRQDMQSADPGGTTCSSFCGSSVLALSRSKTVLVSLPGYFHNSLSQSAKRPPPIPPQPPFLLQTSHHITHQPPRAKTLARILIFRKSVLNHRIWRFSKEKNVCIQVLLTQKLFLSLEISEPMPLFLAQRNFARQYFSQRPINSVDCFRNYTL